MGTVHTSFVRMRDFLLLILVIAVALLCLADEGEARRRKSRRRRKSVSSKSSGHRHIESQIKHLERKFKSLSSKSCKDGAKGKDGDCNNICSEGYQLTFENAESNTGRAACCKSGEVVTPTGSCRPDDPEGKFVPPVCYQLKARLRRVDNGDSETSLVYLRGFEGEINGNTYRCDNDGCCFTDAESPSYDVPDDFALCGLTVGLVTVLDFSEDRNCPLVIGLTGTNKFDIAVFSAFYGGLEDRT